MATEAVINDEAGAVVEVPSYFVCPISLQIMRDPVTLPTGITYDRHNIERWLFTSNHNTCPLTNQPLNTTSSSSSDSIITPNHTLRRLIQAWCLCNSSYGFQRFPTPKQPLTKQQITELLQQANPSDPSSTIKTLRKLKAIVAESDRNRRCVESSTEALRFLVSVIDNYQEEALSLLYSLQNISEQTVAVLFDSTDHSFFDMLTRIMMKSSYQCRVYAILLLKQVVKVISTTQMMASLRSSEENLFIEIVKVLEDKISYQATKAALQVLSALGSNNRLKAVEARGVPVLIELLLDETEKKMTEMLLVVLSQLSECAEGRAEIVAHDAGIAVVAKKLVRVSVVASERAVMIMHSIGKFSPTQAVLRELEEVGAVSKMCLLIQVDCSSKTKARVKELLRLHARVWRNSRCISPQFHISYLSS